MKIAVVLSVAILANSLGNLCLSLGMKEYGAAKPLGQAWLLDTAYHVVTNHWLILGVLLLLVFLASYLTALSWADLSFVLPATAPAYLLTAGLSRVVLHETVSSMRWSGTLLIVFGTWMVARTYTDANSSRTAGGALEKQSVAAVPEAHGSAGSGTA